MLELDNISWTPRTLLTSYTNHWCMGKKNNAVKPTPRKIKYVIRYKNDDYSTKSIAEDLKIVNKP